MEDLVWKNVLFGLYFFFICLGFLENRSLIGDRSVRDLLGYNVCGKEGERR